MTRALVIGLDGMEKGMLEHLTETGVMPFTRALLSEGSLAALRAPVPELSSTSWATFLTGVSPGRHGVFGFVDLASLSYRPYFPNFDHLRAPPLWEAGGRTLSLNVPCTYPARPIDGVLVSGFVVPDRARGVYPPELGARLDAQSYEFDVDVDEGPIDRHAFLGRVNRCLDARARVFDELLVGEEWDLAIAVFTETDRLQHFLWRDLVDATSPLHADVLSFYSRLDEALRALVATVDDDTALFMVSDHGFAEIRRTLYVNAWLRERGYLALSHEAPSLEGLDGRTLAFALDPARIYLHRAGRFPRGSVRDNAASELRDRLRAELVAWRAPGFDEPVFDEVLTTEDAYGPGAHADAPDLIGVPRPGFFVRGSMRHETIVGSGSFTGAHTRNNAIFYARGATFERPTVEMVDVAPTVLAALGRASPARLEGVDVARRASPAAGPKLRT
jgi:predicted AlkP superfamily phosphohydrolase/phosphomutase